VTQLVCGWPFNFARFVGGSEEVEDAATAELPFLVGVGVVNT